MANAKLKTKATNASVDQFLDSIADESRQKDCRAIAAMMRKATGAEPKMWGSAAVGFGDHHYKYESGRENDWFQTGFSPRKDSLTLYFMSGVEQYAPMLRDLGKHKIGKGCLYIKSLGMLINESWRNSSRRQSMT